VGAHNVARLFTGAAKMVQVEQVRNCYNPRDLEHMTQLTRTMRSVIRSHQMDVSDCLSSKLTVWKEDQFTVQPKQGITQREKRVAQWVAKVLSYTGNDTSCEKKFNLSNRKWEDYRGTRFYKGDSVFVIKW
jgi:hypothetical protein